MNARNKITIATLLSLGGIALFLVVDDTRRGIMLIIGSILLNIGINEATILYNKWKGDID